jgi:hypothetical protein
MTIETINTNEDKKLMTESLLISELEKEVISNAFTKYHSLIGPIHEAGVAMSLRGVADLIEMNIELDESDRAIVNLLNKVDFRNRFQGSATLH